jgi:phage tail sheath protein FI
VTFVNSFTNQFTPDVSLREVAPAPSIRAAAIGIVGAVGQSNRGPVGVPTRVNSFSEWIAKFGDYNASQASEGYMFMYNLFRAGATSVDFVRVTDGAQTAATASVSGSTYRLTTPGAWGNNVTVTVVTSSVTGYVSLQFANGSETYNYDNVTFTNANDPNYVGTILGNALTNDDFVEITVIGGTNPPAGTTTFAGGSNGTVQGTALNDSAYIGTNATGGLTGLVAMEAAPDPELIVCSRANAVVAAGINSHVNLATVNPRLGIVALASGSVVSTLVTQMQTFNSDRCVMTYPWLQIINPLNNRKEFHNPTSFYAGLLSNLQYHISPSRNQINNIIGTERALTRADIDTLSASRVSPIALLAGFGFCVMNGYTTSSNPSLMNVTRRRAVNFFGKTFERGLQNFVSKPHTPQLRLDVVTALGNILQVESDQQRIGNVNGGKPYGIKCDNDINPPAVIQANKMMVNVQISLWAPADFINVSLDASEAKIITIG